WSHGAFVPRIVSVLFSNEISTADASTPGSSAEMRYASARSTTSSDGTNDRWPFQFTRRSSSRSNASTRLNVGMSWLVVIMAVSPQKIGSRKGRHVELVLSVDATVTGPEEGTARAPRGWPWWHKWRGWFDHPDRP